MDHLEELLPGAERREIADSSHLMHEDNPGEYDRVVDSFLSGHHVVMRPTIVSVGSGCTCRTQSWTAVRPPVPSCRHCSKTSATKVEEAQDGWAGLTRMGMRVPDLVITELYMDGMEGMEFLRRVRETWPSEPVLVMSSRARAGAASMLDIATTLGANGLLDKPIVEHQLLEAIGKILVA